MLMSLLDPVGVKRRKKAQVNQKGLSKQGRALIYMHGVGDHIYGTNVGP